MKNTVLLFFLLSISISIQSQRPIMKCGDQMAKELMTQKYPGYQKIIDQTFLNAQLHSSKSFDEVYAIPVVVHIVYNTDAQNLPDSVINDQIRILNEDFRRLNPTADDTRTEFLPVAGDAMIEFALATEDPDGNPTSGITRTATAVETFADIDIAGILEAIDSCGINILDPEDLEDNLDCILEFLGDGPGLDLDKVKRQEDGGIDPWDTERYLNIWVCNMGADIGFGEPAPFILGFAYPPAEAPNWELQPLPDNLDEVTGVVLHYQAVGSNNGDTGALTGLNDLGRTCVHEIGHFLGLRHIWGDGDCAMDDGISDTPAASQSAQTGQMDFDCTQFHGNDTCQEDDLPDMIENYMDYAPDRCMNMFTLEQIALMRAMLEGPRSGLIDNPISSVNDIDFSKLEVFPNPAINNVYIELPRNDIESLLIYNANGKIIHKGVNQEIDISKWDSGLYIIKAYDQNRREYLARFIKQ